MNVLSNTDRAFFVENGYLVVPAVVSQGNLEAAINAICEFLQVNLDDPQTWYRLDLGANGIVPLHHAQAFWDNRQHPRVYKVFSELLGIRELWVTMDRASFKPPYRSEWPDRHDDSPMHWDRDPNDPRGSWVQGILYLTDTAPDQGAFECVPKIHRSPERWASTADEDRFLVPKDTGKSETVTVPGRGGTLILWDSRLPHRGGLNYADRPRFTQLIAMHPVGNEEERQERVQSNGWLRWAGGCLPRTRLRSLQKILSSLVLQEKFGLKRRSVQRCRSGRRSSESLRISAFAS